MKKLHTKKPRFIVKNGSDKDVRVLNGATIPSHTVADLFKIINKLCESSVIDALREPGGSLYRELYINKNLELLDFELITFSNGSFEDLELGQPGQVLTVVDGGLKWTDLPTAAPVVIQNPQALATPPLYNTDGVFSLVKADQNHNGYLSKEDWKQFSDKNKRIRVWQYQDFDRSGLELKITKFENGPDVFDLSSIISDSAVIAGVDGERLYSGARWFRFFGPKSMSVLSHSGDQISLDSEIDYSFRVWFLVSMPADADLSNYVVVPKTVRDARVELINRSDIDAAGARKILGEKIFTSQVYTESKVGIKTQTPTADLDVVGSIKAKQLLLPEGAQQGYVLTSNNGGQATWQSCPTCDSVPPSTPYDGQLWVKMPECELFIHDAIKKRWLGSSLIPFSGALNSSNAGNCYLNGPESIPTSHVPYILPFDAVLVAASASSYGVADWRAEFHGNGQEIKNAAARCISGKITDTSLNVLYKAGDGIAIYLSGTGVCMPTVTGFFKRVYI